MVLSRIELKARTLAASGLGMLLRRLGAWRGVLALNYHRIGSPAGCCFDHGVFSAGVDAFDEHVRFLKRHAEVVGPDQIPPTPGDGRDRLVLITFDDGYRDNYEAAFPVLRAHGVGATFFIATGFIDRPRVPWWDQIAWIINTSRRDRVQLPASQMELELNGQPRHATIDRALEVYKSLPADRAEVFLAELADAAGTGRCPEALGRELWMTWDMLREMKAAGMWIGGHTANHPILARLPRGQQELEIAACRKRIEVELGQPMKWFSYPRGKPDAFNADTRACLREQGVELAFSYYGGFRRPEDWDPYDVRRIAVEVEVTHCQLHAMATLPQVFA